MKGTILAACVATVLAVIPASAQKGDRSGHDGGHAGQSEAKATAVVHKVDAAKGTVNVTHDPVPELNWPEMTMDLPVTKRVDLTKLKAGDKVRITIKQGVDKQFRITAIVPAK
jgi:Cu(I)/Ag(I) efflux system protein CusF